jgi:hypothetical protein
MAFLTYRFFDALSTVKIDHRQLKTSITSRRQTIDIFTSRSSTQLNPVPFLTGIHALPTLLG